MLQEKEKWLPDATRYLKGYETEFSGFSGSYFE